MQAHEVNWIIPTLAHNSWQRNYSGIQTESGMQSDVIPKGYIELELEINLMCIVID